jgi:hypothetical protein
MFLPTGKRERDCHPPGTNACIAAQEMRDEVQPHEFYARIRQDPVEEEL